MSEQVHALFEKAVGNDMRLDILSAIEDYCILFGTNALPALHDYLTQATQGWARRPDPVNVDSSDTKD